MSPFIILCASLGYGIESIFGFAGSVVTYLLLTQVLSAKEAIALLPVFALFGSLLILISDRAAIKWRIIFKVCIYAIPGLALGIFFMERLPDGYLSAVVLIIILLYGISLIAGKNPAVPSKLRIPLYFVSGAVIGATSLGVLFVPVLSSELGDRRSFRASLALLWFITAIFRVPLYAVSNILDLQGLISGLWSVPFLFIAIIGGFMIHKIIPEAQYKRYVGIAITLVSVANLIF